MKLLRNPFISTELYRFAILALPAGQESALQPKLGCGKGVLFPITFSPKLVVVTKHIIK